MKSGLSGLIFLGSVLLVGCADKAQVQCETRLEQASEEAFRKGHNAAVQKFDLENLRDIAGDRLACRVFENFPSAIQNMAGLDCSRTWPAEIENVAAAFRLGPAVILAIIIFLGFGFFYFIVPGLGGFAGQAMAAMALKIQPLRSRILGQVNEEEAELRGQLEPLREKIRALHDDAKVSAEKAAQAKKAEVLAQETLDALHEQEDALRDELEHRINLAKKAESTSDLTNLLGQIGKKPSK